MLNTKVGRNIARVGTSGSVVIKVADGRGNKSYDLDEPILTHAPNNEGRECVYIAGPSGSGKSSYAAQYVRNFLAMKGNSKKPFFTFSRTCIAEDPAFEGLKPLEIRIDESLIENGIDVVEEFPKDGCVVLFDDITTIQDQRLKVCVERILADVLEIGRKLQIYVIFCSHLIIGNDKKLARTILNEMTSLTVFPKSGSIHQINYALKTYWGLKERNIEKMLDVDSRWITFFKNYPQVVLTQNECYIMH